MLYSEYSNKTPLVDGVTSTNAYVTSKAISVENFRQLMIQVKEDNINAITVALEARVAQHAKAPWVVISTEYALAKNGKITFTALEGITLPAADIECVEMLNEPWIEIRLKWKSTIADTHGKLYAWVNKRRR